MSRSRAEQRGFSLAEVLSVLFILGLVMSLVVLIVGPLLRSQSQTQAKVDTVQAAAMALYRIERDMRHTTIGSIYACSTGPTPSCGQPATLTATSAVVMSTAYQSGTGQFQFSTSTGKPYWQGAAVYWIDASGNLNYAFDQPTGSTWVLGSALNQAQAQQAVTDVTASGGMQLARFVQQMSLAVPGNGQQVSFQIQAQSTVGSASNETTYQTDLATRN